MLLGTQPGLSKAKSGAGRYHTVLRVTWLIEVDQAGRGRSSPKMHGTVASRRDDGHILSQRNRAGRPAMDGQGRDWFGGRTVLILNLCSLALAAIVSGLPIMTPAAIAAPPDRFYSWSLPVPERKTNAEMNASELQSTIRGVADILSSPDSPAVALLAHPKNLSLLLDLDDSGAGRIVSLNMPVSSARLAFGAGDIIWVGGLKNEGIYGMGSVPVSDAFLAKLDRQGTVLWQQKFGERPHQRSIQSLAGLSNGDVMVSGQFDDDTWLARISSAGSMVWQRRFAIAKSSALAVENDRIFLVALDRASAGSGKIHEEIALWTFKDNGELLGRRVIRGQMEDSRCANCVALDLQISAGSLFVYIQSKEPMIKQEVIRLDQQGDAVWRKHILASIFQSPENPSSFYCDGRMTLLANGDPLLACRYYDRIVLLRLRSTTGDASRSSIVSPDCHRSQSTEVFLKPKDASSVLMLGSPLGTERASCVWFGELNLDRLDWTTPQN